MTTDGRFAMPAGAVKICGLRTSKQAGGAALAGADLIGFIFAPARRQVTPDEATASVKAARLAAGCRRLIAVGVFVDESVATMNAVADAAGLDLLQLHGDEDPDLLAHLRYPVTKAVRLPPGTTVAEAEVLIGRYETVANAPVSYLVDGFDRHHHGGQGVRADWELARELATRFPIMLAGGLDGTVVAEAIERVRPIGVDVSSGVETEGVKDIAKITAFVDAARRGFAALGAAG